MNLGTRIILCSVLLAGMPLSVAAQVRINPMLAVGFTDGGDRIGSYTESYWGYWGSTSEIDVRAGESVFLFGGATFVWPWPDAGTGRPGFGLMLQGGVMDGGSDYTDEVDLNRNAVEVLGIVEWPKWRFGAGFSRHLSPVLEDTKASVSKTRFRDATGLILQFDWYLFRRFSVGMRYVDIDYETTSRRIDASNYGVIMGWRLGRVD